MRKVLLSTAVIAVLAGFVGYTPARAQSAATISGSGSFTHSTSAVVTQGLAVGVAAGTQINAGNSAGVAAATPLGNFAATVSQNQHLGNSTTFAAGVLGGTAAAANQGANFGAAGSLAFTH